MNQDLKKAIKELDAEKKVIKKRTLDTVRTNRGEATEYFMKRLDDMIENPMTEDFSIINESFFGVFFLAEWKEVSAFKKVQKLLKVLGENTQRWTGDALTENFPAIMYQLYDGDFENLKDGMVDNEMETFARTLFMDIIFQMYADGEISKSVLFETMEVFENIPEEENDYYFITEMCLNMAKAHLYEYLPKIRKWFEAGFIDPMVAGYYTDYVDIVFEKRFDDGEFVNKDYNLEKELHKWYEIEGWENKKGNIQRDFSKIDFESKVARAYDMLENPFKNVGRNDPCPCGSGKKYKKCHLLMASTLDNMDNGIEKNKDRDKHLRYYPRLSFNPETMEDKAGFERDEGRLYLEDLYDRDSIAIDYYVYLAFKQDNRAIFDIRSTEKKKQCVSIKKAYLERAKELYDKKIIKEKIKDSQEFDKKYSIHYMVDEWINE